MACLLSLNNVWKWNHAIEVGIRLAVDFKSFALLVADLLGKSKALYPAAYADKGKNYYYEKKRIIIIDISFCNDPY